MKTSTKRAFQTLRTRRSILAKKTFHHLARIVTMVTSLLGPRTVEATMETSVTTAVGCLGTQMVVATMAMVLAAVAMRTVLCEAVEEASVRSVVDVIEMAVIVEVAAIEEEVEAAVAATRALMTMLVKATEVVGCNTDCSLIPPSMLAELSLRDISFSARPGSTICLLARCYGVY